MKKKKGRKILSPDRILTGKGFTGCAAAVVFVTTYMLILPAITASADTYCGNEEHTHEDSCYEEVLICGKEETEGHTHTDSCYSTNYENN